MSYYRNSGSAWKGTKYKNPFFPKNKKGGFGHGKIGIRGFLLAAAVVIVLAGWAYLFLRSSYFAIARVDVYGDNEVMKKAISDSVNLISSGNKWLLLPKNNIYIFPKLEAEEKIKQQLLLEELVITKQYPNSLRVDFKIKKPAIQMTSEKWLYVLDAAGEVIERRPSDGASSSTLEMAADAMPVLEGSKNDLEISSYAIEGELAQFIISVFNKLPERTGVAISFFSLPADSPSSLKIKTEEGWDIILNMHVGADSQIEKLSALLKERDLPDRRNLNYIDLRFGDRIFYK